MKSKQLLSIVFSLIMFTGVTTGNAVFAESDDDKHDSLDDRLEAFCEMTDDEKRQFFADHPRIAQFEDRLANFCSLGEDEREDAIDEFIAEHVPEERDYDDYLEDKLDRYCEMTDAEKQELISKYEKSEEHVDKMNAYCELDDDARDAYIDEHKDYKKHHDKDMREIIDRYCEMTDEDKKAFLAKHDKAADHAERMNKYCELDEDAREDYIKEHKDDYKKHHGKNIKDMADKYCEMSDAEKQELISKYEKSEEHVDKMNEYCNLDEDAQDAFIADFKDKMSDYKKEHMMNIDTMKEKHKDITDHKDSYKKFCQMTSEELEESIDNPERLAKVTEWCDMSPEEREDYKKKHHDVAMDFKAKHMGALDRMKEKSDLSPRLKAMIMEKHDISDERMDEIKMKYREKHGDITDEQKFELKMKFKDHMASKRIYISDERKSEIHDRIAEMKLFKAELREKASELTDAEKQELRAQFIEKAKDMQLAWISPHHQMNVGIDADEIECREGHSLVMKKSNGVPMCLKADTALVMIERGIAVPAN